MPVRLSNICKMEGRTELGGASTSMYLDLVQATSPTAPLHSNEPPIELRSARRSMSLSVARAGSEAKIGLPETLRGKRATSATSYSERKDRGCNGDDDDDHRHRGRLGRQRLDDHVPELNGQRAIVRGQNQRADELVEGQGEREKPCGDDRRPDNRDRDSKRDLSRGCAKIERRLLEGAIENLQPRVDAEKGEGQDIRHVSTKCTGPKGNR